MTVSLLATTLARLDAADEHSQYVAGDPDGTAWFPLDRTLADDNLLDEWYRDVLARHAAGRRDVAGSYLASWLSGIVAEPVVAAVTTAGRAWPVEPGALALHRHEEGWFDGIAVRSPRLRVLPTDPDIGAAHTEVVAGPATLHAIVADELVAIATTIFAAVRRLAPFGLRGMWGNFADGIAEGVVWRTRNFGEEAAPARRVALQLVDALADRVPALTVRPRFERVAWSGGTAWLPVKSTCCLYYKTFEGSPDPCGDGYCTSCPFRDDAWRLARWATWLETNA